MWPPRLQDTASEKASVPGLVGTAGNCGDPGSSPAAWLGRPDKPALRRKASYLTDGCENL